MTTRSVIFSTVAILAVAAAAQAGPSEAMAFAIGQCSSQPDERARLACYDQIAAQLKAGVMLSAPATAPAPFVQLPVPGATAQVARPAPVTPAPVMQARVPAAVAPAPAPQNNDGSWYDPTSWFGKNKTETKSNNPADFGAEAMPEKRVAANEPARPETLNEIRAGVASVAYNQLGHFTVTLDNGQVWKQLDGDTGSAHFKSKGGNVVTISRGMLGSYNLVVDDHGSLYKVKRIQ